MNSPFDLIEKHEYKADKYAVHELLPFEDLEVACKNGYTEYWQLAEHLDLTEEFIKRAVYIYECEGLSL